MRKFALISLLFFTTKMNAQIDSTVLLFDEDLFNNYIELPSWGTQFINLQSARILPEKNWGFKVQHRFGSIATDSSLIQNFLGLDLPTTMRLSFDWSINRRWYVGVGRSNSLKLIDLETKYLLLRQTDDFKMPISVALYFNTSIRTSKFSSVAPNAIYQQDSSRFYYKPAHRLAYFSQIIISSVIFDRLTLQVSPIFIYHNLAPAFHKNMTYAIGTAIRFKWKPKMAFMFEYTNKLNNHCFCFIHPLSFGLEIGTEGHNFQLFISNSSFINPTQVFTISGSDMTKGRFLIGFNLHRSFLYKKYRKKE